MIKLLIVIILLTAGCALKTTKATEYCDANWKGRFNSWQDCYDRKMSEKGPIQTFGESIH